MDTPVGATIKLGSAALEDILCGVSPMGSLADLVPYTADAWQIEYSGLDALPRFEGEPQRLRICVATEDIVGPVRNGGIGTTYAALAELLAQLGHDVTILYLKGHEVENGTIEHWVDFYAAKKVRFVPVPNYASMDRFQTGADRWLHGPYNMLRYLLEYPMDVVHVSEWRGSGYLSLLAKRQGLAFEKTLFVVKTSSPWIWNRLYGSQPLDRLDDLAKVQAERRSVEFADMVIGGSLHLLRWMASQGYKIPHKRTFVQPNIATFAHLGDLVTERTWVPGTRHNVDEIVFFGRLEARKGLLIFVHAIRRLLRQGRTLPPQVTFMGKPGARLMARPDQDIIDYIKSETSSWPTKVEILSELQQYDALKYLLSGNRLAVMPSMIENSSLAVYEAAVLGIPFIASASGGTPELVATADHPHVLCEAHPIPLASKIADALDRGGYVASPSFDNDANLEQWRQFHRDLGRGLLPRLLDAVEPQPLKSEQVSVCIYHAASDESLRATLASLAAQEQPVEEVIIAVDTDDENSFERAKVLAEQSGLSAVVVAAFDLDAGQAFNLLAEKSRGGFLLFLWAGATLKPIALRALTKVANSSSADVVNYFFRVIHETDPAARDYLSAIIFGGVAQSFFRTDITALPLLVRRDAFARLGGFTPDFRVLAHDHEFVGKAQISGFHCETALVELGTVPAWDEEWLKARCYDQSVAQFRAIRPEIAAAPLALRELLLMAKGLQRVPGRRAKGPGKQAVQKQVEKETPLSRLLTVLSADMLVSEGDRQAKAAPPPPPREPVALPIKRARPAVRGIGLVQLIDGLSLDDETDQASPSERAVRRPERKQRQAKGAELQRSSKPAAIRGGASLHWISSEEGQRYTGRVLGVYQGNIYGWVRNEDRPQRPVEVESVWDGGRTRITRADIVLPTVLALGEDVRNRGFIMPIRNGWPMLPWDARLKNVSLRVKGTDISIGEVAVSAAPNKLEQAGFDGFCDIVDANIRGWVWQPSNPHNSLDVAAFVDGRFLARIDANTVRDDLRAANVGTGAYGFSIVLPKQLRDGTPRRIDVVVADSGLFLKRGRLQLVGDQLTVVDRRARAR